MVDSTAVRGHRSAAGAKGQHRCAIGRSRGGPTTKIHALADSAGRLCHPADGRTSARHPWRPRPAGQRAADAPADRRIGV